MEFSHKEEAKKAIHIINTLSSHKSESSDCSRFIAANPFIRSLKAQTSNHSISLAITNSGVLLVNFTNVMRDVTATAVFDIFRPFGKILKIIVFEKGGNLCDKALVQFRQLADAARAYEEMNNAFVWENTLVFVQFSRLSDIKIKPWQSKDKFFDLAYGEPAPPRPDVAARPEQSFSSFSRTPFEPFAGPSLPPLTAPVPCAQRSLQNAPFSEFDIFSIFQPTHAPPRDAPPMASPRAPGCDGFYDPFCSSARAAAPERAAAACAEKRLHSCVLLVSNLTPKRTKAIHVFNLFSQYGQVVAVKILPKKPDRALVQLINSEHAGACKRNLNALPFEGQLLSIVPSHFSIVTGNPDQQMHLTFDSRLQSPCLDFPVKPPSNSLLVFLFRGFYSDSSQVALRHADALDFLSGLFSSSNAVLEFQAVHPHERDFDPFGRARAGSLAQSSSSPNLLGNPKPKMPPRFHMEHIFERKKSEITIGAPPARFPPADGPRKAAACASPQGVYYKLTFRNIEAAAGALARLYGTQRGGVTMRCQFF